MSMGDFSGNIRDEVILAVPDSTLETALDLVTDGNYSAFIGTGVSFTFANNFEVATNGANTVPAAVIESVKKAGSSYELAVNLIAYEAPFEISKTGLAVGDYVESAASGAWQKDNTNGVYRVVAYTSPYASVVKILPGITKYVAVLGQTISGTYTQAEVQAISTKVDLILTSLVASGAMKAS